MHGWNILKNPLHVWYVEIRMQRNSTSVTSPTLASVYETTFTLPRSQIWRQRRASKSSCGGCRAADLCRALTWSFGLYARYALLFSEGLFVIVGFLRAAKVFEVGCHLYIVLQLLGSCVARSSLNRKTKVRTWNFSHCGFRRTQALRWGGWSWWLTRDENRKLCEKHCVSLQRSKRHRRNDTKKTPHAVRL